jgi:hypothetical protein
LNCRTLGLDMELVPRAQPIAELWVVSIAVRVDAVRLRKVSA